MLPSIGAFPILLLFFATHLGTFDPSHTFRVLLLLPTKPSPIFAFFYIFPRNYFNESLFLCP